MKRIVLLIILVTFGALFAQQKGEPQLHVVTYVDVYPNFAADTAKYLQQFAADSLKEGAVRFDVLRDVSRANHFAIVEVWRNRQAYETHLGGQPNKQFREKLQMGLGSPYDERLYNALP
jgi:quinol monooxygenase YgiN